jgi:hypothetical protein
MNDRNLLLIQVFEKSGFAGDHAIDSDEVAQLRKRFNVKPDEFCIVLVGKDGTEKHRERSPIPMNIIYSQIDQMSMRRQEMSDRSS